MILILIEQSLLKNIHIHIYVYNFLDELTAVLETLIYYLQRFYLSPREEKCENCVQSLVPVLVPVTEPGTGSGTGRNSVPVRP